MASQEHLQQLLNDESDDSSSSSSSSSSSNSASSDNENDKAVAGPVSASPTFKLPSSIHQKKRMKISIKASPSSVQSQSKEGEGKESRAPNPAAKRILPMASSNAASTTSAAARSNSPTPQRQRLNNKRSLPIKKKKTNTDDPPKKEEGTGREIKVMEVDSDGDDNIVATAVFAESTAVSSSTEKNLSSLSSSLPSSLSSSSLSQKKKTAAPHQRNIRLPPFSSPGLLVPKSHSVGLVKNKVVPKEESASPQSVTESGSTTTMGLVFDDYLTSILGYTEESRTQRPHIGSSVKRQVGDMFDSDVHFSAQFPRLVPENLIPSAANDENSTNGNDESRFALANKLIQALEVKNPSESSNNVDAISRPDSTATNINGATNTPRKRQKLLTWKDMVPISLTMPYSESYVQKQKEYVAAVNKRESAILVYKKEVEALERENPELSEENFDTVMQSLDNKPTTIIPPIPRPPSPPHLSELTSLDKNNYVIDEGDSQHPIYLPKSKELVAHLDKECFHITNGRYFGLSSNMIADPHFVGPVAPGVNGLNLTASNGLATAQAGGGGINIGGFANQPSAQSTSGTKGGSGKKNSSQVASPPAPTVTKKKKKKPAIALPLKPMSVVKKVAATPAAATTAMAEATS